MALWAARDDDGSEVCIFDRRPKKNRSWGDYYVSGERDWLVLSLAATVRLGLNPGECIKVKLVRDDK